MALVFEKLHSGFAASVGGVDLREVHDQAALDAIRAGMDEYAVLVFRDQKLSDAEQLAFARRFDGELHSKTGASVLGKNRHGAYGVILRDRYIDRTENELDRLCLRFLVRHQPAKESGGVRIDVRVGVHRGAPAYLAYLRKSGLRLSFSAATPSRDSSVS